jgi:hypothetical protein
LPRDKLGRFVKLLDYRAPAGISRRMREAVALAKVRERGRLATIARKVEEESLRRRREQATRARLAALAERAEEENLRRRSERERDRVQAQIRSRELHAIDLPPTRPGLHAPELPPLWEATPQIPPRRPEPAELPPPPPSPASARKIPALPGETEKERQRRIRRERRQRETELLQEQRRRHAAERVLEEQRVVDAATERAKREAYEAERAFEESERARAKERPKETPVTGLPGMPGKPGKPEILGPEAVVLPTTTPEQIEERLSGRLATPEEILEMALRETRDEALHQGMMQPFVPEAVLTRNQKNLSLGQAVKVGQMLNEPDVGANVEALVLDIAEQIQGLEGSDTPVYVSIRITEIMPLGVHVGSIDRIIAEGSIGTVIESWQGVAAESSGRVRTAAQVARSAAKLLADLRRNQPRSMAFIEGIFVRSRGRRQAEE